MTALARHSVKLSKACWQIVDCYPLLGIVDLNRPHEVILAGLDNNLSQRISLNLSLLGPIKALIKSNSANHASLGLVFYDQSDKLQRLQIELMKPF